ncbi:MAG: glycosyltransferase [Bacilli bacterium]
MNVLILTGKFGMGHISAAKAIKEQILKENPNCNIEIIDFIEYMFPKLKIIIYGTFNFLVGKCHKLYNLLNHISSRHSSVPLKKIVIKKINNLLTVNNIDLVISVLPICSQYISAYKKMFNKDIPLNTCITDVLVHEEWITDETNLYFVSSTCTKDILISKKVDENKIIVSGIPVLDSFKNNDNKKYENDLLIMGGGLGLIPSLNTFLNNIREYNNIKITIIAGSNKNLYNKLTKKYPDINIVGFTNNVAEYLKNSKIIITKPGGITLFESIESNTPLLVINPFLSQEIGNAKYIENNNIGKVIWKKDKNISKTIINLINSDTELNNMKNNMQTIKNNLTKLSFTTRYNIRGENHG